MHLARFDEPWCPLSQEHRRLKEKMEAALDAYISRNEPPGAYIYTAVFGGGKTKELFEAIKESLRRSILPMYTMADNLFEDVFAVDTPTPEQVAATAEKKLAAYRDAILAGDPAGALAVIDPHGAIDPDMRALLPRLVAEFGGQEPAAVRMAVFVDELESVYQRLQEACKNPNPLRPWLELRNAMRFLAIAPAGMTEMGGADKDRVERLNIPGVDVEFLLRERGVAAGRANAAWWLGRGKARQVLRALEVLGENQDHLDDARVVRRLVEQELNPIGQHPVQVPAANTGALDRLAKLPHLANLEPVPGAALAPRFVVPVAGGKPEALADDIAGELDLPGAVALLVADYFCRTLRTVAGEDRMAYIDEQEVSEFFHLALDHLLEYEYGLPDLDPYLGTVLALYERTAPGQPGAHALAHVLRDYRQRTTTAFPLSARELRQVFPFPTMSPTLGPNPSAVQAQWEREDRPLWWWSAGGTLYLFFIKKAAFERYAQSDAFLQEVLPDGRGACCLFAPGEQPDSVTPLVGWLRESGKLTFLELNALVSSFLLSLAGPLRQIPGYLTTALAEAREQYRGNTMALRKIPLYEDALREAVAEAVPSPRAFCFWTEPLRQDARNSWGAGRITRPQVAVAGLTLAFAGLSAENGRLLAAMRELFRSPRGPLRTLLQRSGGLPTLIDDLMPFHDGAAPGGVSATAMVARISELWDTATEQSLHRLAHLLPRDSFVKLAPEGDDFARVLEAFWRARRGEHEPADLAACRQKVAGAVAVLQECRDLHDHVRRELNLGVDFGTMDQKVQALEGLEKLLQAMTDAHALGARLDEAARRVTALLVESLELGGVAGLQSEVRRAASALTGRANQLQALRQNVLGGCSRAVELCQLTEETLQRFIREDLVLRYDSLTVQDLTARVEQQVARVDGVNSHLAELERNLVRFEAAVGSFGIRVEEAGA